jgi:hypothetical protein
MAISFLIAARSITGLGTRLAARLRLGETQVYHTVSLIYTEFLPQNPRLERFRTGKDQEPLFEFFFSSLYAYDKILSKIGKALG